MEPFGLVVIDYQRIIYTQAGLDYRSTSDEILVWVVTVAPDYFRAMRPDYEFEETRWMEYLQGFKDNFVPIIATLDSHWYFHTGTSMRIYSTGVVCATCNTNGCLKLPFTSRNNKSPLLASCKLRVL